MALGSYNKKLEDKSQRLNGNPLEGMQRLHWSGVNTRGAPRLKGKSNPKSKTAQNRCLICHEGLPDKADLYHEKCALDFFGTYKVGKLELDEPILNEYIKSLTEKKIAIPGVQKKLSFD